jgi:hypothetical protein
MAVIFPRFMRRPQIQPDKQLAPSAELQAMMAIEEWLATVESEEAKLRLLSYFMWRLKSGDSPKITDWVESIAEQSTMIVSKKHGFSEGVE